MEKTYLTKFKCRLCGCTFYSDPVFVDDRTIDRDFENIKSVYKRYPYTYHNCANEKLGLIGLSDFLGFVEKEEE